MSSPEERERDDRFRDTYDALVPRLKGFILAGTEDGDAAQDVLQETMLRFWRSPFYNSDEPRTREETQRYVFRIASNLLKDRWKSRARYAKTLAAFEEERPNQHAEKRLDVSLDVEWALRQLKPRDRMLLWMAHGENYTHAELGEMLGYNPMSIRVLLSRARARLRKVLADSAGG